MKPYLSIIVPTYQEERTIGQFLEQFSSQLCQQYRIELILSDGGSSDRTLAIAQRFTSSLPLHIVVHTGSHRQTIAEGRNAGAQRAQGETLIFLNSDTSLADPNQFFQWILHWTFYAPPTVVAIVPWVFVIPEQEQWIDKIFHHCFNRYITLLNILGIGAGRGEAQIVRRNAFWQIGGYNTTLAAGEDFDLYARLAKIGTIQVAPQLIVYENPRRYRQLGYFRTVGLWAANTLSIWLRKRSISQEWEPIR